MPAIITSRTASALRCLAFLIAAGAATSTHATIITTTSPAVVAAFQSGAAVENFDDLSALPIANYNAITVPAGNQFNSRNLLDITKPEFNSGGATFTDPASNPGTPIGIFVPTGGIAAEFSSSNHVAGPLEVGSDQAFGFGFMEVIFQIPVSKVGFWVTHGNARLLLKDTNNVNLATGDFDVTGTQGNFIGIDRSAADIGGVTILGGTNSFTLDDFTSGTGSAPTNHPPTLTCPGFVGILCGGEPVTIHVEDVDNDPLTVTVVQGLATTVTVINNTAAPGQDFTFPSTVEGVFIDVTVDDGHGGTATCSIFARPTGPPTPIFVCQSNITTVATSPAGAIVASYPELNATDFCDGSSLNVYWHCNPLPGSLFPIGTTPVSCFFDDGIFTFTCDFTVTVTDTPCITVNIYDGFTQTGGGAPYTGLVGSFNSPDIQFATSTGYNWHPFGLGSFGADITGFIDVAAAGTYTFTLNSDDGSLLLIDGVVVVDNGGGHAPQMVSGNATLTAGSHSLEVQFFEDFGGPSGVDLTLPQGVTYGCPADCTLTCPTDITQSNDPGLCSAVVQYPPPTPTGNCTGLTIVCVPPSGSSFPVGTTVVHCTATDANSNVVSSCSFNVTVRDTEPPVASCTQVVPPVRLQNPLRESNPVQVHATDNCDSDPKIYLTDSVSGFVAGPFHNNDKVSLVRGPSLTPLQKPGRRGYVAEVHIKGDALIWAVDAAGNASAPTRCH